MLTRSSLPRAVTTLPYFLASLLLLAIKSAYFTSALSFALAANASAGTPYLLPYDGDPRWLDRTALPLANVLRSLGESKAKDVLAIVDSCFSGAGGRSVLPPGARPLARVKEAPVGARVALFSASSGAEISGPASGAPMGLFTKYVNEALGRAQADIDGD